MGVRLQGRLLNQREIAEVNGVSTETIRNWVSSGCPTHKGPKGEVLYLPSEVYRWREDRATQKALDSVQLTDIDEARRRKVAAEAAMAELELAKKKNEVVEIALVGKEIGNALSACRARLIGVGAAVMPRLQTAANPLEMKAAIDDEIHLALEEISDGSFEFASGAEADDPIDDRGLPDFENDAAADADAQRVGRR